MREGQGTIGGRAPEGMMRRKVPCEASQDVYALGHLILLTLSKAEFKSHNMWVSKVGAHVALLDSDYRSSTRGARCPQAKGKQAEQASHFVECRDKHWIADVL